MAYTLFKRGKAAGLDSVATAMCVPVDALKTVRQSCAVSQVNDDSYT